jgi:predicted MFS family arabinose efflux permease
VLLSRAGSFHALVLASALLGTGSAIFHPEASRLARLASGGKHGFAQSLFQVGGNLGSSLGPLLAADRTSIEHVFWLCSFLPLIGLLTAFLPDLDRKT